MSPYHERQGRLRVACVLGGMAMSFVGAFAQFSPGQLSRPHMELEGTQNCAKCHEVGKAISGVKCMTCHTEIKSGLEAKSGYHFNVSAQKCVTCHKEHLGRDVQTILFDRSTFDHTATGFTLTGKHSSVKCESCHRRENIKDSLVRTIVAKTNRSTFLGLERTCVSCHEDRHRGTVGIECQSCHTTTAWVPAPHFDHSKTRFALAGKHAAVQCAKCHSELLDKSKERPIILSTKSFSDCTPCHSSPHKERFGGQLCKTCHSSTSWSTLVAQSFDHNLTGFRLVGRHAALRCEQCHKSSGASSFSGVYRMPHGKCTDCHTDYHAGEFIRNHANDCSVCHTVEGFSPSTFTFQQHGALAFALTGAHAATPCYSCHGKTETGRRVFHFASTQCASCHSDQHGGQFDKAMADQSCAICHSTSSWKPALFDHGRTTFALTGKHATAKCESCHKLLGGVIQYRGLETRCESCHSDTHAGQFAAGGKTECVACHSTEAWRNLVFDHNRQSAFALTGAHAKAICRSCHMEEEIAGKRVRRFKPLSMECESCHKESNVRYE